MDMVNIKINGMEYSVPASATVLEAARFANIDIPTLCYLKDINKVGSCRMCLVEIKGGRALQAACVYPVSEGMEVFTNTPAVREARRVNLELILSNHDRNCLSCVRNRNCELQKLAEEMNIDEIPFEGESKHLPIDDLSPSIVRDPNKCILCRRCVSMCKNVQTVSVIDINNRGFDTTVGPAFGMSLAEVPCVNCGQCITVCPVGALSEKSSTKQVWDAIADPNKHVVVQTAPAVRVSLGEEFGMPIGSRVTGKLAAALRRMGFDGVFDTDTGADFTIMEDGTEFMNRLKENKNLPLITSCSPGWVQLCEHNFPDFLDNLSTAKSPMEMFGAIIKSYYAKEKGIDPKDIYVVSVMPCTAKKFESQREEMDTSGTGPDIDAVLTTRELGKMIKEAGLDFVNLPDEAFDQPFGQATGAAVIFGATGGVMEAALRTVVEVLSGETLSKLEFDDVRGTQGLKEANLEVAGRTVRVAVVSGLGNARRLFEKLRNKEVEYDFIEVMACPGGCVTGGGQSIQSAKVKMDVNLKKERAKAIYAEDQDLPLRKSHENPIVQKVYKEFLGEPCGHKSHELLHTHYTARGTY